jgi:hypothetical protein
MQMQFAFAYLEESLENDNNDLVLMTRMVAWNWIVPPQDAEARDYQIRDSIITLFDTRLRS